MRFPVGVLRPNWLQGATNLGQRRVDGFLCNVWEKVDFIWYYENVLTKRRVQWVCYTGCTAHGMTLEVGAVLEDAEWQAPLYSFGAAEEAEGRRSPLLEPVVGGASHGVFMRGKFSASSSVYSPLETLEN